MIEFLRGYELDFTIDILLSLAAGFIIGAERESRGKAAGISTNCFVIGGSMIFTYLSALLILIPLPELPLNLFRELDSWVRA